MQAVAWARRRLKLWPVGWGKKASPTWQPSFLSHGARRPFTTGRRLGSEGTASRALSIMEGMKEVLHQARLGISWVWV